MKARNVVQHVVPILNLSKGALGSYSHLLQRFKSISQEGLGLTKAVTVLGVDVGTRHVGLAVSDAGGKIAFPLRGYRRTDVSNDIQQLRKAVSETSARAAVVGVPNILYPRHAVLPTPVRDFILAYATKVLPLSGVRVVALCDENFSSSIARDGVRQSVSTRFWNDPVLRKRAVDANYGSSRNPILLFQRTDTDFHPYGHPQSAAAVILQDMLDAVNALEDGFKDKLS